MAANWAKIGKWAAILTPIAIVGGWYYIKVQKTKALKLGEDQPIKKKPSDVVSGGTNTFPLKVGVKNNDYVKILQAALGVSVDGDFGTKETLPALQLKANKSEIKDLQDLNDTIAIIKSYTNEQSRIDRIFELLDTNQSTAIVLNKNASISEMGYDKITDMWTNTGVIRNLGKGFQFITSKYQFKKAADFNTDVNGDLIIYTNDSGVSYSADSDNFNVN
jgi:hypothetical protein